MEAPGAPPSRPSARAEAPPCSGCARTRPAKDINENHRNTKYLGNEVELADTLKATTDFSEAANCADVIVMGVPSHGFRGVLSELAKELRPWVPVVSLVKGLEQGTNSRMTQIVDEVLPGHPAGILAGPNIAREVADGYAAAAVLAMPDQHLAARLAELFRTRRFRTYTTDDVVGVEMAGRAEERLRHRCRDGLLARHRREHPRDGDGPRNP